MQKAFLLKGLDCPHCSAGIEREVGEAEGVISSSMDLMKQTLTLEIDPSVESTIEWLVGKIVHRYEPKVQVSEIGGGNSCTYILKDLDCANCAVAIERDIAALPYVSSAEVSLVAQTLEVEFNTVTADFLFEVINELVHEHEPDVEVTEQGASPADADHDNELTKTVVRFAIGAVLYLSGLILPSVLGLPFYAKLTLLIAAYIVLGIDVVLKALKNILRGHIFDENFLMTLSTVGAFAIGEYPEAVAVMLFYQIGEFFQSLAVRRSRKSIAALMDIRPDCATVSRDGELKVVSPESVSVGELIVVKPGEKIPLDGIVVSGESMVDTMALTGESVPHRAAAGSEVLSGCINQSSVLTVRVTKPFGESTAVKILDMVENASARKAPTENFITTFARYYTPAVVILAAILAIAPPLFFGGEWVDWIRRGFVFLVISCPCALVISIPLTFFGGIGTASKHGVLVKGSNYLEALTKLDTVVFDKTGTLTKGVFKVSDILPSNGFSSEQVLEYAAAAESFSNHPIAKSILAACGSLERSAVSDYCEISGQGVSANFCGKAILAGNDKLMEANAIEYTVRNDTGTKIHIAVDGKYAGCILISDELKPDSTEAVAALHKIGIKRTVMLTGDNEKIAADVSAKLGIDEYYAQLLPHEKVDILERLDNKKNPGSKLAFVGDGINDAPVLARADIGIAMGGLGSDAAIEAADVVLMTDEPSKLVEAIAIAKSTKRIVVQNIIIALGIKGIFLILGAFGIAGMWEAVFGDVGVALIAVLNAMRILKK